MFETLINEFKNVWRKSNNSLMQIIVINIAVFVLINIVDVIFAVAEVKGLYKKIIAYALYIPAPIKDFAWRPWTLFTYFFTHKNLLHLFFNMWVMYWFGMIIKDFLGSNRLLALYIWGGIAGGLIYLLCFNTIPYFIVLTPDLGMLGASACVYAIVTAAATFRPNLEMNLLFFGNVRIVWVALIVILLSFIGIGGASSEASVGGNLAHLGGAILGFVFIKQLERGNDWSVPIDAMLNGIRRLFGKKGASSGGGNKSNKTSQTSKSASNQGKKGSGTASTTPSQAEIDAILDKISANGYESLTTEEKQILFKASQKK
jgi:membrane associated rhomboid family serine protease